MKCSYSRFFNRVNIGHVNLYPIIWLQCLLSLFVALPGTVVECAENDTSLDLEQRYDLYDRDGYDPSDADIPLVLDLKDSQEMLILNNLSIEIAYERLYSARQKIKAARGMFFPDLEILAFSAAAAGLGGGSNFAVVSGILLGVHALSIPSKWFEYKATKLMAKAEVYTKDTVKRNVWAELNKIYYQIVGDELVVQSLSNQCALKRSALESIKKANLLGTASDSMERDAIGALNLCRANLTALSGVVEVEYAELKNLLRIDARKVLILERGVDETYSRKNLPLEDRETLAQHAIKNSSELKQIAELVKASRKMRKSEKWSILMFKGMGFGYQGRLEMARSRERQIRALEQQTFNQIRVQVYSTYSELEKQLQLNEITFLDLRIKKQQAEESKLLFHDHLISFDKYHKAQERFLQAKVTQRVSSLMTKIVFSKLARQVGFSCEGDYYYEDPGCDTGPVWQNLSINQETEIIGKKKNRVTLFLEAKNHEDLWEVESTLYRVSAFKKKSLRFDSADHFSFTFDTYKKSLNVRVKIQLYDGTKLVRNVRVNARA